MKNTTSKKELTKMENELNKNELNQQTTGGLKEMTNEIKGIANELSDDYCEQLDYSGCRWKDKECDICRAERLYRAGYRKWHKVADGDLPNDKQTVLIVWKDIDGEIMTDVDKFVEDTFLSARMDDIIAWIELPTYEE